MRGYVTRITLSNTQTTEQMYGNSRIELATAWRKCSFYDTATDESTNKQSVLKWGGLQNLIISNGKTKITNVDEPRYLPAASRQLPGKER